MRKIREVAHGGGNGTDLHKAVAKIPQMSEEEIDQLCDLLEFGADEIQNYHGELKRREKELTSITQELGERYRFENIVGTSRSMQQVFRLLEKIIESESTVLIHGESGTGKELVARAIHYNGPRAKKAFVVQNCSAFNDNLLESALFGHTKGSFTGAIKDKKGLFEIADGGTFFLDEVGDMSPSLQVKLLRVLQEGTFTPVGGTETRTVDVRVIAATHKDLQKMVERGEFREDLYYRINVIKIQIPPLRDRMDDLPILCEHFLRKHFRARPGTGRMRPPRLGDEALAAMQRYPWPGNIRELENEIERCMVLGGDMEELPEDLLSQRVRDAAGVPMTRSHRALRQRRFAQGRRRAARARSHPPGAHSHALEQVAARQGARHLPLEPDHESGKVRARQEDSLMKPVNCPTCKKPVAPDAKSFPFCSERCRLVDLGNWLDGKYRIASTNDERKPDDDEDPED